MMNISCNMPQATLTGVPIYPKLTVISQRVAATVKLKVEPSPTFLSPVGDSPDITEVADNMFSYTVDLSSTVVGDRSLAGRRHMETRLNTDLSAMNI